MKPSWAAEIVVINSPKEFFAMKEDQPDAFVYSAEAGAAWSLVHPEYTVAIPYPDVLEIPLAYGIVRGNSELKDYLNIWIDLKEKDRTLLSLYDHWILGKDNTKKSRRWSVIRDVLHWIE